MNREKDEIFEEERRQHIERREAQERKKLPPKQRKKKNKPGAGRKWFDGQSPDVVIPKLESVWGVGGSDKEAAFYADISPTALSRYLQTHPKIAERKEALLERPVMLARKAVLQAFDGHEVVIDGVKVKSVIDAELALKYLERKAKAEFSTKSEIEHTVKTLEQLVEETNQLEKQQ